MNEGNTDNNDKNCDDDNKNPETNNKEEFTIESDIWNVDTFQNVSELDIRYFAGFVLFKMQQRLSCNLCKQIMFKSENVMAAPSEL